ncbi:MAG: pilus assembly protein CpaE [Anaerolineaceae bacterium]|nr:pilus assembly protein CpaE [Anaerolineaceae bacterium]MCB9102102.1 pilus assembly protein CpaE [Anaerolineales bacterium]
MLSINLAQHLKAVGLEWQLQKNDFFHIPDRGFDDTVFVVTDMTVLVEELQGNLAITFHGTVEWALDHVWVTELVWLPSESQLREELERHLVGEAEPSLVLISTSDGYRCEIRFKGEFLAFEAFGVSDVYAMALLYVLQNK